ncbi:MAG: halocarboxylic acid dehydrogenase DehI family protein [Halobacteriota archaeon]|uniref:halocarboxylic acid dehydrogenase DehI family protein n=1 Tax=Natronomonas sp. TaxID=2184060 RepID=UPI003976371E
MDTSTQLYDYEATGWKRGLYDDIKHTFRAPIVNWIFRTTMANHPEFVRHMWGQIKPAFETRQFGRVSIEYRDAVLSAVESERDLPVYRREDVDVSPAEYAELRRQLATFDVVAPRLAVLFELVDRALSGQPVGTAPVDTPLATEPLEPSLDRDRGAPPTLAAFDDPPAGLAETVESIQSFHGIDEGLPSVHRCLAQWPGYLERSWGDIDPALRDDAFADGCSDAREIVEGYVESLPYEPQLGTDVLSSRGLDEDAIEDLTALFREFNLGAIETVVPSIHVFADTLRVVGERDVR